MRKILKLAETEIRLFFREPQAVFFTLAFPLMMLFLFGSIYGNEPAEFLGGFGFVDILIPSYTALIIATAGIMGLTISLASYREQGILRRFQASPVTPLLLLIAESGVYLLMTVLGLVLLAAAGIFVFSIRCASSVIEITAAFILSCFSLFSLGFMLSSITPTARSAHSTAMAVFFPMIFLSGATLPTEILPEYVRQASQILPLTHVVTLMRGLWTGHHLSSYFKEIIILVLSGTAATIISVKTFRWK